MGINIAVVGAASLAGQTLLDLLANGELEFGRIYALDEAAAAGGSVNYGERELDVTALDDFDFASAQIVIFVGEQATTAAWSGEAQSAGATVIDTSGYYAAAQDVPLVVPDLAEPAGLPPHEGVIAVPCAPVVAAALALQPIAKAAGLLRVDLVTLESVSGAGRAAVEELGQQTAALLNFRDVEVNALPQRIAFNLLPQVGALSADGDSGGEMRIATELQRLLSADAPLVDVTSVQVPLFYGDGLVIHAETRSVLSADEASALLQQASAIELQTADGDVPTPAAVAVGNQSVWCGRVRISAQNPKRLKLWLTLDGLRAGLAHGCVRIVECLLASAG